MPTPKRPLEFYGRAADSDADWVAMLKSQSCPFLERRCVKQRKSNPRQTTGACAVGYQDHPLIICPHRFLEGNRIFLDAVRLLRSGLEYFVLPEITLPGGSVDYFVVAKRGETIEDYLGLEIQSLDTTGSGGIWKAHEDLRRDRLAAHYAYGVNWKMSAKTILVQLHHKAAAFEALGKKLVLVIQTEFLNYMTREFQTTYLRDAAISDSVWLNIYDCVSLNNELHVVLAQQKSTNVVGVDAMLRPGRSPLISEADVIRRLEAKMPQARRLKL